MDNTAKTLEVLVVWQGFEKRISEFTMDDFRGDKLPNYEEPGKSTYRKFYYIQMQQPGSRCRWGYSRWVTGENGKLTMLDNDYDSSD